MSDNVSDWGDYMDEYGGTDEYDEQTAYDLFCEDPDGAREDSDRWNSEEE